MKRMLSWWQGLIALAVVVAFAFAMAWLLRGARQGPAVGQPAAVADTPLPEGQLVPTATLELYPSPTIQPTVIQSPTVVLTTPTAPAEGPETPPVPGKAATLFDGDVWLVEQGHKPEAVTDVGDVAAIFGWNWDGSKLLIGRGRKQHEQEFISDTTDLWVIDLATRMMKQLTTGSNVHTAVWSPIEDHIAYCDQEAGVKVITLEEKTIYKLPNGLCIRSSWSPDGKALATAVYSGEDPRPYKELENEMLVLAYPYSDTIKILTEQGSPYAPVWSIDGKHILFQQMFLTMAAGETPWYLADISSGAVTRLDSAPPLAGMDPLRSPRGNFVVVSIGEEFYVLGFAGNSLFDARGGRPVWAPDGQTIVNEDEAGRWQAVTLPLDVGRNIVGGGLPAPVLFDYLQWKFFFAP